MMSVGGDHRFVFYGDACSGVPGGPHEATFAATNRVIRSLDPTPDFLVFAGDEVVGLTTDEADLVAQWRHWLDVEMGWLDQTRTPLYNTTSNHTTYDLMSERVFAEMLSHLPRNGPPDQLGLSYHVRKADLLLVFVNTSWSGLGGEGHVETEWLGRVLEANSDAGTTLVVGHHPVFPVNGFSGPGQREIDVENGRLFWDLLVEHRVTAYLCSHILAFDVQVHDGVLQIVSAGAGTAHRMPPETEYLHFVDMTVSSEGLRYEVIDQQGAVREQLQWPADDLTVIELSGVTAAEPINGQPQTLLASVPDGSALPPVWIGLTGRSQRLTVILSPAPGRSPHYWFGPDLGIGQGFDFQLGLHRGMGPGGVLWRPDADGPWSSLTSASPWGLERIPQPIRWQRPEDRAADGPDIWRFRGSDQSLVILEP